MAEAYDIGPNQILEKLAGRIAPGYITGLQDLLDSFITGDTLTNRLTPYVTNDILTGRLAQYVTDDILKTYYTDDTVNRITNGQLLKIPLTALAQINVGNPQNGESLVYDGNNFVNQNIQSQGAEGPRGPAGAQGLPGAAGAPGTTTFAGITDTLLARHVPNNLITGDMVADRTIDSKQLAADSVVGGKIAANAVVSGDIKAGAIKTADISDLQITYDKLSADVKGRFGQGGAGATTFGGLSNVNTGVDTFTNNDIGIIQLLNGEYILERHISGNLISPGAISETLIGNAAVTSAKLSAGVTAQLALLATAAGTTSGIFSIDRIPDVPLSKIPALGNVRTFQIQSPEINDLLVIGGDRGEHIVNARHISQSAIDNDTIISRMIAAAAVTDDKLSFPITQNADERRVLRFGLIDIVARNQREEFGVAFAKNYPSIAIKNGPVEIARFGELRPHATKNSIINSDVNPNTDPIAYHGADFSTDVGIWNGALHLHSGIDALGSIRAIGIKNPITYKGNEVETIQYAGIDFTRKNNKGEITMFGYDGTKKVEKKLFGDGKFQLPEKDILVLQTYDDDKNIFVDIDLSQNRTYFIKKTSSTTLVMTLTGINHTAGVRAKVYILGSGVTTIGIGGTSIGGLANIDSSVTARQIGEFVFLSTTNSVGGTYVVGDGVSAS